MRVKSEKGRDYEVKVVEKGEKGGKKMELKGLKEKKVKSEGER